MADKPLKKLVEERRKPVIVHHSTWLGLDPHELNDEGSFHAGTMKSAYDRLPDGLDRTLDDSDYESGEVMDAYMHSYEMPRSVINPVQHRDPGTRKDVLRHSATSRKRSPISPEFLRSGSGSAIAYPNEYEDPGSTSYLIPSHLVNEGRIKHLGAQFVATHTVDHESGERNIEVVGREDSSDTP